MSEHLGTIMPMDWIEVRDELIRATPASPLALFDNDRPGIYAWWDPSGALTRFWPAGFPQVDPTEPLYIGIARTTLAERGGEMHLENTRMSTIRRSLAALLVDELHLLPGAAVDLNPRNRTKFSLGPAAEQRLTSWMKTHLRVTWILHPTPGDFEKDIVKRLTPPLNHTYATKGPYAKPLQVHREKLLGRMAATMLCSSGTLRRRPGFRDSSQTEL